MSMAQAYEVKNMSEILDIIEIGNAEIEDQVEYNLAVVYKFPDGRIALVPSEGGQQEGILFYDEQAFKEMVESKRFPVKPGNSIFESDKERIKNIESNVSYFVKQLSDTLRLVLDPTLGELQFGDLSEKINEYGIERWEHIVLPLGVFLGEVLRLKIKGKWKLQTHYSLNLYWTPNITDDNKYTYMLWGKMYDEFLTCIQEKKKFDLRQFFREVEIPLEKFKF
jgi:hypothetical protein